jgi:hypothetical protein
MVGTADQLGSPPSDEVESVDPENRLYQPVSTRGPALVVLGLAIVILVLGVIGSVIATGTSSPGSTTRSTVRIAGGKIVALTPATSALASIVSDGQPPTDIISKLAVPANSTIVRTLNSDGGVSQFDRTVFFTTHLSQAQVVSTYRSALPHLGWNIIYHGPQTGGTGLEVLAKRGSSDGFYWETGVVVAPTTAAGATPFSVEVFELSDDT